MKNGDTVIFGRSLVTGYPLFWNILGEIHGLGMYMMCRNNIVDNTFCYHNEGRPVSYQDSHLRHYMSDIIYSKCFSPEEKKCIIGNPCMLNDKITIPVFNAVYSTTVSPDGMLFSDGILSEAFPFNADIIKRCSFSDIYKSKNAVCLTNDRPFTVTGPKISTFSIDGSDSTLFRIYINSTLVTSNISVYPVVIVEPKEIYKITHIIKNQLDTRKVER